MVPKGWNEKPAKELCHSISVGIVIKPSQYYVNKSEGIKAFRSANVRQGNINDNDWVYLSKEGHNLNKKSHLQEGDVLIVRTGYPGTACVVTNEYVGVNAIDIVIARPKRYKILPEYLCSYTNSEFGKAQVLNLQGGMAQQHLNVSAYQTLKVPVPPLSEQRKIAKILSTWDKAIGTTERLIANSKQQKKALMQQLLTGKKRFPGFHGEWVSIKLGEICSKITDGAHHSPPSVEDGCPMFSVKDMGETDFRNTARNISKIDFELLAKQNCQPVVNDILIAKDGSILKHCFVVKSKVNGVVLSSIAILRPKTNLIFPYFLMQYLKRDYIKRYVGKVYTTGSGVPRIVLKDFKKIKLKLPSEIREQVKIAETLSNADKEIVTLQQKLTHLKQEKKALMQQLLTGKRRVKVDELATPEPHN